MTPALVSTNVSEAYIIVPLQISKITILTIKLLINILLVQYKATIHTYTNSKYKEQTQKEYYNNL